MILDINSPYKPKSSSSMTCGWCVLGLFVVGKRPRDCKMDADGFTKATTVRDKIKVLSAYGLYAIEVPSTFDITRYAGSYILDGITADSAPHSIACVADEASMSLHFYDPAVAEWTNAPAAGFRITNILLVEDLSSTPFSWEGISCN